MLEQNFQQRIKYAKSLLPERAKSNGEIVGLAILSAISNTYKSMEKTFINDPSTNKLFSNEEILRSMDKVMDKVKRLHQIN
ncbi:hypothetical protein AAU57_14665 [Nonlabens sp. YIK11]|nr:hypothetical protein AAU57_14665 [Nonlabens sp. YIK11]